MSHRCQFITGGHSDGNQTHYDLCGAPAYIKESGFWLCDECYDWMKAYGLNPADWFTIIKPVV